MKRATFSKTIFKKMKKRDHFFSFLLCVSLLCFHTTVIGAVLEGKVVDEESGEPIYGVNIVLEGTQRGVATDLDGRFRLEKLPVVRCSLLFSNVGYESKAVIVNIGVETPDFLLVKLQPTIFELNPVVVTGTGTTRLVEDVTVRTEVITSRELQVRSAPHLFEALETIPGMRVEEQCQACNFSQVRINGLGNDHIQILMDGLPVYSGLTGVYGLQQFSTTEIEQIEIVRGAGSALYGANAVAGALNIITTKPLIDKITAGIEIAEYGSMRMNLSAGIVRKKTSIFIYSQIDNNEALDLTSDGDNRSQVNQSDGITDRVEKKVRTVGVNFFINDINTTGDEAFLRLNYLNENRTGGELAEDIMYNPFTLGTEQIMTDRLAASLGYTMPLAGGKELALCLAIVRHNRNATNDTYLNDYMSTHEGELPDISSLRPYLAEENTLILNTNYTHTIRQHHLLLGLQTKFIELVESGRYVIVDENDPNYSEDYTSISEKNAVEYGIFAQDEWELSPQFALVAGVRADWHDSKDIFKAEETDFPGIYNEVNYDENSVNPRFALKFVPSPRYTFRIAIGTGFRVPFGFSEDLHLCSGSPRVWKGPELKPEVSRSINLSLDAKYPRFSYSLQAHATRLLNAVGMVDADEEASSRGFTYAYENIDDAATYGLDIGIKLNFMKNILAGLDLSFFNGEYDHQRDDWIVSVYAENSKNISRFPSSSGSFNIDWSYKNLDLYTEARYTGKMYIDYAHEDDYSNPESRIYQTEPYIILNCRTSLSLSEKYLLYIGVKNLGDYIQPVRHTDDAAFMFAPVIGRLIYSGVRITL